MEVILEIFRNDHARKEGEDIFNKFRVYLFIEIRDFKVRIFAVMFHTPRKHTYIILNPWNPLLYSKNGVYRAVHIFFLFLLKNIDCGYTLEPPRRGHSNEYPQSMFWAVIW